MGGSHSAKNYYGMNESKVGKCVGCIRACCQDEVAQTLKGVARKDRYRLMELLTTEASLASVMVQMENKDSNGKRGAKIKDGQGNTKNWILEFAIKKGGVWPKAFQKLSIDDRFVENTEAREELRALQEKIPSTSAIGIAAAISNLPDELHSQTFNEFKKRERTEQGVDYSTLIKLLFPKSKEDFNLAMTRCCDNILSNHAGRIEVPQAQLTRLQSFVSEHQRNSETQALIHRCSDFCSEVRTVLEEFTTEQHYNVSQTVSKENRERWTRERLAEATNNDASDAMDQALAQDPEAGLTDADTVAALIMLGFILKGMQEAAADDKALLQKSVDKIKAPLRNKAGDFSCLIDDAWGLGQTWKNLGPVKSIMDAPLIHASMKDKATKLEKVKPLGSASVGCVYNLPFAAQANLGPLIAKVVDVQRLVDMSQDMRALDAITSDPHVKKLMQDSGFVTKDNAKFETLTTVCRKILADIETEYDMKYEFDCMCHALGWDCAEAVEMVKRRKDDEHLKTFIRKAIEGLGKSLKTGSDSTDELLTAHVQSIQQSAIEDEKVKHEVKVPLPIACSNSGLVLISERASGQSISSYLDKGPTQAVTLPQKLEALIDGLQFMLLFISIQHANLVSTNGNVMHTDLHPGNVMIQKIPGDPLDMPEERKEEWEDTQEQLNHLIEGLKPGKLMKRQDEVKYEDQMKRYENLREKADLFNTIGANGWTAALNSTYVGWVIDWGGCLLDEDFARDNAWGRAFGTTFTATGVAHWKRQLRAAIKALQKEFKELDKKFEKLTRQLLLCGGKLENLQTTYGEMSNLLAQGEFEAHYSKYLEDKSRWIFIKPTTTDMRNTNHCNTEDLINADKQYCGEQDAAGKMSFNQSSTLGIFLKSLLTTLPCHCAEKVAKIFCEGDWKEGVEFVHIMWALLNGYLPENAETAFSRYKRNTPVYRTCLSLLFLGGTISELNSKINTNHDEPCAYAFWDFPEDDSGGKGSGGHGRGSGGYA